MKKFVVNLFSIVFTVSMLVCCASTKGVQKEIIYRVPLKTQILSSFS